MVYCTPSTLLVLELLEYLKNEFKNVHIEFFIFYSVYTAAPSKKGDSFSVFFFFF